jgi:mannosyltransferase OCH1-like enzyme
MQKDITSKGIATPKIFSQTWKTYNLPEKFMEYRQKWIDMLPDYTFEFYDDNDLRNLVKNIVPQYLQAYDMFSQNIERVDFARYVMMYATGGVYADLDTYPLKSIDKWISMNKIVLGTEPHEHSFDLYNRETVLCNAFMISPPGQKLWLDFMDYIIENYEPYFLPVETSGPMALTRFYEKYPEKFKDVVITEPCVFYPLTGAGKVTEGCNMEKDSYVVHVWSSTWNGPILSSPLWFNKRYWCYAIFILLLFLIFWFS